MEIDDILKDFEDSSKSKLTSRLKKESSGSLYEELVTAMINERMAPELLPYKNDLMQQVLSQLSNQQQYLLDSHEYGDTNMESGVVTSDFKLQLMIIETDIERLNYLVRLYLRSRISKIDKFALHYINETSANNSSLLSPEETEYMHKHFKILTELYNNCFMKKMPEFLTYLDDTSGGQSMITTPDLDEPVFIKSVSFKPILISTEDDEVEIVKDGIYVVKYNLVKRYIEIGDIILI